MFKKLNKTTEVNMVVRRQSKKKNNRQRLRSLTWTKKKELRNIQASQYILNTQSVSQTKNKTLWEKSKGLWGKKQDEQTQYMNTVKNNF